MVQDSLVGLYQFYHILKYYGQYTTFEVDNMLPFEREIFYNLLLETKQKEKNNNG